MEISNEILAVLVLVAIIISVVGTAMTVNILSGLDELVFPITGMAGEATGTAVADVQITADISLNISSIDFKNIVPGNSNDTADDDPQGFVLQNDGSVDVNVTVNATRLWNSTVGASASAYFQFNSSENESGCVGDTSTDLISSWTNIPVNAVGTTVTTNLNYSNGNDAVNVEIKITCPDDEPSGQKGSTLTFGAKQS